MKTIGEIMTSPQAQKKSTRVITFQQRETNRKFQELFRNGTDVLNYFTPTKAGHYAVAWEELIDLPNVLLCDVNAIYKDDQLAQSLIKLWIIYVIKRTGSRAPYTNQELDSDAADFLMRHGNYCTVQMLAAYCSSYTEDYADTVVAYFAYADLSKNFRRKFLAQWNEARWRILNQQTMEERKTDGLTGKRALKKLFFDFIDGIRDGLVVPSPKNEEEAAKWNPDDFHQILLWSYLTPEDQAEIEEYARNRNKPF